MKLQALDTAGLVSPSGLVQEFWVKLQEKVFTMTTLYLFGGSTHILAALAVQSNEMRTTYPREARA